MAYTAQLLMPPRYGMDSRASSINENGSIAGYYVLGVDNSYPTPTLWSAGGQVAAFGNLAAVAIASPSGSLGAQATAVNIGQDVVGYCVPASGLFQQGFLIRGGSDMAPIVGPQSSLANDINDSGRVVGGGGLDTALSAFIWDSRVASEPTFLGALPGHDYAVASAVNGEGVVVGFSRQSLASLQNRCFVYRGSGLEDLGPAGQEYDISDNGIIVGSVSFGNQPMHAARLDLNQSVPTWEDLGVLPNYGHDTSMALGISPGGDVIVGTSQWGNDVGTARAFFYVDGKMWDLNLVGVSWTNPYWNGTVTEADAIDSSGRIVGHTTNSTGDGFRACLLTPPPFDRGVEFRHSEFVRILVGIIQDGGGVALGPRGVFRVPPRGPVTLTAEEVQVVVGLALHEIAGSVGDEKLRARLREAALTVAENAIRGMRE